MARGRVAAAGPAAAAAGALALAALYAWAAFVLPGGADVTANSSGIFDMDVQRVVVELTTAHAPYRASVHPLQKLFTAPLGSALRRAFFADAGGLGAAKLLIAGFMLLQAILSGALAFQLAGRAWAAGLLAGAVCGVSFSSLLAASIPESAAFSSVGATLPLLWLGARRSRSFTWGEVVVWGVLAVVCAGFTVSQILCWAIAFGARGAAWLRAHPDARSLARLAAPVLLGAALFAAGLALEAALYPSGPAPSLAKMLETELAFTRFDCLFGQPLHHVSRLFAHFALYDFAPPFPGYSDFLMRDYRLSWWSLSLEEARWAQWTAPQLVLAFALLCGVALSGALLRRAGSAFHAPLACVVAQFALHLVYGREYVLYSPNWHGVLVALLVAAAWNGLPARRRLVAAYLGLACAAMLANNLLVMRAVYREVHVGLGRELRDDSGAPLRPLR